MGLPDPTAPNLTIVATDVDARLLERAARGCYRASSLKELPWLARAFETHEDLLCVREALRPPVEFVHSDIRRSTPAGLFDLVLCRNLVPTYFSPPLQQQVMQRVVASLRPGGALVLGIHERLPDALTAVAPWPGGRATYRKGVMDLPATPSPACAPIRNGEAQMAATQPRTQVSRKVLRV